MTRSEQRRFLKWLDHQRSLLSEEPNTFAKVGRYFVIMGILHRGNQRLMEKLLPSDPGMSVDALSEWRLGVEAACSDIDAWLRPGGHSLEDVHISATELLNLGYEAWRRSDARSENGSDVPRPRTLGPTPVDRIRYRDAVTPATVLDRFDKASRRFDPEELDVALRGVLTRIVEDFLLPSARELLGAQSVSSERAGSYLMDGYLLGRCILGTSDEILSYSRSGSIRFTQDRLLNAIRTFEAIDVPAALGDLTELVDELARRFTGSEDLAVWSNRESVMAHATTALYIGIFLAAAEDCLTVDPDASSSSTL